MSGRSLFKQARRSLATGGAPQQTQHEVGSGDQAGWAAASAVWEPDPIPGANFNLLTLCAGFCGRSCSPFTPRDAHISWRAGGDLGPFPHPGRACARPGAGSCGGRTGWGVAPPFQLGKPQGSKSPKLARPPTSILPHKGATVCRHLLTAGNRRTTAGVPAPLVGAGQGGGSHGPIIFGVHVDQAFESRRDPPPQSSPTRGEEALSPAATPDVAGRKRCLHTVDKGGGSAAANRPRPFAGSSWVFGGPPIQSFQSLAADFPGRPSATRPRNAA